MARKTHRWGFGRPADMPPRRYIQTSSMSRSRICDRLECTIEIQEGERARPMEGPGYRYECPFHWNEDDREFKSRAVYDGVALTIPDHSCSKYQLHLVTAGKTVFSMRITKAQAVLWDQCGAESARIGMRVESLGRQFSPEEGD